MLLTIIIVAQQKLNSFLKKIKDNNYYWDSLVRVRDTSKLLDEDENTKFEQQIAEIF